MSPFFKKTGKQKGIPALFFQIKKPPDKQTAFREK